MKLKKSLASILGGAMIGTSLPIASVFGEEVVQPNLDDKPAPFINPLADLFEKKAPESLEKLAQKGFAFPEKAENYSSARGVKLDLFYGNNLEVALKEGMNFILDETPTNFIEDKKIINRAITKNSLLCECITSTINYINNSKDLQGDKQFEILKRLVSIQKLIEIDDEIPKDNAFLKFIKSMNYACKMVTSRSLAAKVLEENRKNVEDKMGSESASRNANISSGVSTGAINIEFSAGTSSKESSSEKSFYKVDTSGNVRLGIGAGLPKILSANVGTAFELTNTLIFYSLEQFLDAYAKGTAVSSIEIREPEIRKIVDSREEMKKNEKSLLSSMQTSIEWYLKASEIVPQSTNFEWNDITRASSPTNQKTFSNKLDANLTASCLASIGMNASASYNRVDTSIKHSYLSLLEQDCSPSYLIENSSQIVNFLKENKVKKYKEIKDYIDSYLSQILISETTKKADVLSIIISNIIGDLRQYNSVLSILANPDMTKEEKRSARELKHKIEENWIDKSQLARGKKGRLEMLKVAISVASYLRENANIKEEIDPFKDLYVQIEHLSKMQSFSKNPYKQEAQFDTHITADVETASGQTYIEIPFVGKGSLMVRYNNTSSDADFDTSEDAVIKIQIPMFADKILGDHSIKNKFEELIEKLSKNEENSLSPMLKESLSLINKNFYNVLKDFGIETTIYIPEIMSVQKYMILEFHLTKIDKTLEGDIQRPLPGDEKQILKLNDEWVLKLIKRTDSAQANLNVNIADAAKLNVSDQMGKSTAKIGADTLSYITSKYNVLTTGLADKSDKTNYLWDTLKSRQTEQLKKLFGNVLDPSKNVRYELQKIWNKALSEISSSKDYTLYRKEALIKMCQDDLERFLKSCERYSNESSEENFNKASDAFDNVMKINYKYNYLAELQKVHAIENQK